MRKVIKLGFIVATSIFIYSCDSGSSGSTPVATPCSSAFSNNDIHLSTQTWVKNEIVNFNDINLPGYQYSRTRVSGDYLISVTQIVGNNNETHFVFLTQPLDVNNTSPDITIFDCSGNGGNRTNSQNPTDFSIAQLFMTRDSSKDNIIWD